MKQQIRHSVLSRHHRAEDEDERRTRLEALSSVHQLELLKVIIFSYRL